MQTDNRRWTAVLHIDNEQVDVDLDGVSDLEADVVKAAIRAAGEWVDAGCEVTLSTVKTTKAHGSVPSKGYRMETAAKARYSGRAYL